MNGAKISNRIAELISTKETAGFKFQPDRQFFERVEIGQKRFGQLIRNEKPANLDELAALSKFFDCDFYELIEL